MLEIVIPMAGSGSRFSAAGYQLPKPLLPVYGSPMFRRVVENLKPPGPCRFTLVVRDDDQVRAAVDAFAAQGTESVRVVTLARMTEGAAETVAIAVQDLPRSNPLVIANSDQLVRFEMAEFLHEAQTVDGQILVFPASHSKWSFIEEEQDGRVCRVAEKEVISNWATVGVYYFGSIEKYLHAYGAMRAVNDRVNGEFYVAPVYNYLIRSGGHVRSTQLRAENLDMFGLGTPEDYERFLALDPFGWGNVCS